MLSFRLSDDLHSNIHKGYTKSQANYCDCLRREKFNNVEK